MKTLIQKVRYVSQTDSKQVIIFIFALLIIALSIVSAFADDDNGHNWGNRGNSYGHQEWRGDRDRHEWRGDHEGYENGYGYENRGYSPRYQQPYYNYAQPIYIPPPVYYAPQQSPGISLFFPLNIRR
jgi:hypothetical protein